MHYKGETGCKMN